MPKLVGKLLILCALFAALVVVTGCGSSLSGDSVAEVGDQTVKTDDFNHRMLVTFLGSAAQTNPAAGTPKASALPAPPDFKGCIAAAKKAAPKPAKGQPAVTDATYKKQCATAYGQLRDSVLQTMIQADWITGESADQGVKVTDAAVKKQFNTLKKQQFPKDADFQKFLKSSGLTLDDLYANVRLQLLTNKLRTKIVSGKVKVTPAQIQAYYAKNKATFGTPEHRSMRVVLNKNKADIEKAQEAVRKGTAWAAVAKKYSTDPTSKATGGVLSQVTKGQEDPGLDKAVFSAKQGKLIGPIKTNFGYYIFEVTGITPAVQQTVAQATPSIRQILQSQGQQNALNKFVTGFQKKWTKQTDCRKGFVISICKNFVKPKTSTSTAAAGASTPAEPAAPTVQSTTG
jgi:foldase protein PrsA